MVRNGLYQDFKSGINFFDNQPSKLNLLLANLIFHENSVNSKKYDSGLVNNLRIHSEPQRSQIALSDLVMLAISGPGLGPGEMGPFAKWSNLECRRIWSVGPSHCKQGS